MNVIMVDRDLIEKIREGLKYGETNYIFITTDGSESLECKITERIEKGRKVRCSEDNMCFDSITEAAQYYDCTQPEITLAIKRRGTCHGYHFHYWYGEEHARKFDEWILSKKENE